VGLELNHRTEGRSPDPADGIVFRLLLAQTVYFIGSDISPGYDLGISPPSVFVRLIPSFIVLLGSRRLEESDIPLGIDFSSPDYRIDNVCMMDVIIVASKHLLVGYKFTSTLAEAQLSTKLSSL
jgi:hypothetical protein